jgi:alkanesulfonate monooxygenase SsuD/methylene tetrahydromethanopterin reductase-like flavin-dependent oxidoreductase (luciferase family)
MKVGSGLPNAVPETSGEQLVEFARRADQRGFSSLGTIDRIVYGNYEPLAALAAAAVVTERIELMTSVMLGPLRLNAVQTAKQALSVNQLAEGRLTLGVGIGARGDDFDASGVDHEDTGSKLEAMLDYMTEAFADERIGPRGAGVPRILIGGHVEASFERAAKYGEGWIAGGAPPDQYAEMANGVKSAWSEAGRDGEPRLAGLAYYSLGDQAEANADSYLNDYYGFLGTETAQMIADSAATDPETVKGYLAAFEDAGCGELIMFPCSGDPAQADLLADAAGL